MGRVAAAMADVSLIARGPIWRLSKRTGQLCNKTAKTFTVRPHAMKAAALGPQDYVVVSLKSHQAPGAVEAMQPLLGPDTTVATAMNGVPWWYF